MRIPQSAGYATKPSLPMAVATSVHIAKRNSVLGAEDECLCGQIRLCGYATCAENNKKSSPNRGRGCTWIIPLVHPGCLQAFFSTVLLEIKVLS
uniref:Uncharacterized protein n=1 Tax=Salarias fasciatus TaxID=181472 RepID=A0A672HQM7_SALFA